ncbi:CHAP domain-containing protein [Macrococcus equipercicus]|uniref:CHAP domain-containing protein n=1 Tax=Macrococcus equipercicus TaxID=69967 RepID=A0A9Q9BW37_9STAP|nr:CHAP domain-containing protein [Macrococcus equipercicus]KAA1042457.1 CHAP domain-containing protein [Macrococcus equipercicus]UTH14342.1 CHAP domain-containing protein [Macrococcus equipercicus]
MKKLMLTMLTILMLITIGGELNITPFKVTKEADAAAYANPIRYKAPNYYTTGSCAYYAFNRRAQMGRYVSNQWGNAKYWASNAVRYGYTVRRSPIKGSVLVSQSGYYGHVAVVESIYSNGDIIVSEMNYPVRGIKTFRKVYRANVSYYQYIY